MPHVGDMLDESPKRAWWKESNVYQIYPASFKDSNGDGVGDIPGIISKLDYIKNVGVDVVWLCPCYKSPQVDMGYDISDYRDIYEKYGTLSDIDELISGLHKRGLKFVMDLVVNHTSDQNPKAGPNGERVPPNNWVSHFGGSTRDQPDFNWENPKVRAEVHDIIRFWLDRGVDGFGLDAIKYISKNLDFPDAPVTIPSAKLQDATIHYANGPRLHEFLRGMGKILREYYAFIVGEMGAFNDPNEVIKVVAEDREELNMILQFEIVTMDHSSVGKYFPRKWKLSYFPRTTSGTVFVYEGQELGMANMPKTWGIYKLKDLESINFYSEKILESGASEEILQVVMADLQKKCRDNSRTPMQWDSTAFAGFSTVQPWMDVIDDYKEWNVASQVEDLFSDIFVYGSFTLIDPADEQILAYARRYEDRVALVITPFSEKESLWTVLKSDIAIRPFEVIAYLIN
ncbi:glycoside hydrolase superfamily [Lipomyces starkeyi]